MTLRSDDGDGETPLSPTELRALRRLAEPETPSKVETDELWASRYRIVEPLGHGGMGDVFLARDVLLDRLVALKVLRTRLDDDMADERLLLREARAAARAEHERIARVYDAGTWSNRAFIAMEYVRGQTLRAWLTKHRPSSEEILFVVQQLLEGVRALHERGLVHRDLKPENVMVASDGNLRILDLGIARRVPLATADAASADWSSSATIGFGVGTPGYMAPEQWQGLEIDSRADLFALGVLICELVVGRAPFRGDDNAAIRDRTLHAPLSFDSIEWLAMPQPLRDAARIALSRDREQRFPSVGPMYDLLAPLFRTSVPPLSSSRAPSDRPSEEQTVIDSAQGSALGVSIRAIGPQKSQWMRGKRPWALVCVLAAAALTTGALTERKPPPAGAAHSPGMVRLSGGTFSMGSDQEDLELQCPRYPRGCPTESSNEIPRHAATVAPFELDEREVTNQEFSDFLFAIGSSLRVTEDPDDHYDRYVQYFRHSADAFLLYDLWPGTAGIRFDRASPRPYSVRPGFERLPVTQVSWLGARLFCLNAVKRLPTEAEWEFAASGLRRRPYPWGSAEPDCNGVHIAGKGYLNVLNPSNCDRQREIPFPVMTAAQDVTPDGVSDLGGNVAEWVDSDPNVRGDAATYAAHLASERPEVFRGAAFDMSFMARSTARNFRLAFNVGDNIGFRCAKSLPNSL